MKRITSFIAIIAMYIGICMDANAHAVWIQSDTKAIKNKNHEVTIFYGEYASAEFDSTHKWYSDLKNMEVWLVSPTQRKTKLVLSDRNTHMSTSFTPDEDGTYYLTLVHGTKELGGTTKYEFSSMLSITCGVVKKELTSAPTLPLSIRALSNHLLLNKEIELEVKKGNEVFANAEVVIMSPQGWTKTIKTNAEGKVLFVPEWKGRYVIESTNNSKENGEWYGKAYNRTWQGSTTSIVIN